MADTLIGRFQQINPHYFVQHKIAGGENILRALLSNKFCVEECIPDGVSHTDKHQNFADQNLRDGKNC